MATWRMLALLTAAAIAAALVFGWHVVGPAAGAPAGPPNVVFFLTDDQRYDQLPYMPIVQRELVARGVSFANAYATTPYCCPSRASILTGLYAHNHGVLDNEAPRGGYSVFKDEATLPVWLQRAGVRTLLTGKYLNQYGEERVPPGWSEWFAFMDGASKYFEFKINQNGEVRRYPDSDDYYSADVLTEQALALLRQETDRPFFLYLSFDGPHEPALPARQDKRSFAGTPLPQALSFNEADVSDKPSWVRGLPLIDDRKQRKLDKLRRDQLATLQAIDRSVGAVIDQLRADGRLANTWLVFMSDNSISLGEHRYGPFKSCGYEECVKIPLVVTPPPGAAGFPLPRTDAHLVLNIDIAPTIAALAGAEPDRAMDGASLLPLLADPEVAWRTEAGLELLVAREHMAFEGLRADRWKYLRYLNGEQELYDLEQDPSELENLAARPEQAARLAELSRRLDALMH